MHIIDLTSPFIWVFLTGSAIQIIWNSWLAWRDRDFTLKTEDTILEKLSALHQTAKDFFSESKLKKSLSYERTCSALSMFSTKVSRIINAGILLFGFAPWLLQIAMKSCGLEFVVAMLCIGIVSYWLDTVVSLPFKWHSTFTIEERFGFNTMTKKLFWQDLAKEQSLSLVFSAIYTLALYFSLYYIHQLYGKIDWKLSIVLAVGNAFFSLLVEVIYMKLILPLFNKVEPMKDCELKTKMEDLLKKFGFSPKGVFVIDASKRSKHSNAYCTGWGKNKRLVLFDTLLKDFTDSEILAILGHELAHSKLNHLVFNRILECAEDAVYLVLASVFIYSVPMLNAFGYRGDALVTQDGSVAAITAIAMIGYGLFRQIYDSLDWITDGIGSWISRKMEFAADQYSCRYTGEVEPMITSLFKLYGENLSYPVSDPLFEAWHFSHPSLVNRVEALKKLESEKRG